MARFEFLDWLWMILFLVLMTGAGVLFYRLGRRSEADFFLAGRGLPWWLPASSVYATHTATDTPMWVTGVVYRYGLAGLWYTFFSAWCAISAFVSTRIFRRSLAYTQAEWQSLRFSGLGSELLRGWIAGWQVFMNMFIMGWVGIAMGKVCNYLFGWPTWVGLVVFSSLCAIYVLAAGYWGVVMADFQQGIIALAVIVIVSIWGVVAAGGPHGILHKIKNMNSSYIWNVQIPPTHSGKLRLLNPDSGDILAETRGTFLVVSGTRKSSERLHRLMTFRPDTMESAVEFLYPVEGDTLFTGEENRIIWTGDQSLRHVRLEFSPDGGMHWQLVDPMIHNGNRWRLNPLAFTGWFGGSFPAAWFVTMFVIALLGGFGMGTSIDWYVEAQRIQSARTVKDAAYSIWAGTALVLIRNALWAAAIIGFFVLFPGISKQSEFELGWYILGIDFLPAGMVGFFFAAILAIHLSTISTHLNLGATYVTRDIYHHYINPQASQKTLVWVGRISTLLLLLGSFLYGLMMQEITRWLIFALWIMAAGVWLPNILQVVWWRFNSWGYLASWIANLGFSWLVVWILPNFKIIPVLPDYLQFWSLMVLGALVFIPVTLLTKPEDMDHLVTYYVMSRPIGWWGPVRREAERKGLIRKLEEID